MKKTLLALVATSVVFVAPAFAADIAVKAPPPAPLSSWSGFYFGGNLGAGWGGRNFGYAANDPGSAALFSPILGGQPPSGSVHASGALGGFQIGRNWQFARQWVAGFEADFDLAGLRGTASGLAQFGVGVPVIAIVTDRLQSFGTVRARFGFLPGENLLVYGIGGLAYAKARDGGTYLMTAGAPSGFTGPPSFLCVAGATCFTGSNNSWIAGWTAGAGLEYAFASRWSIKTEYLFASLRSKSLTETATQPFPPQTALATFNVNSGHQIVDIIRVGINYRL